MGLAKARLTKELTIRELVRDLAVACQKCLPSKLAGIGLLQRSQRIDE